MTVRMLSTRDGLFLIKKGIRFPSLVLVIFIGTADMPLQVLTIFLMDIDGLPNGY